MSAATARPAAARPAVPFVPALQVLGATLLGTNADIHAYLWDAGYRTIPTIGTLFLLDVIASSVLAVAVLVAGVPVLPRWILGVVAALGALLEAGTVAGLLWSTHHLLFGWIESTRASLYWESAITEIAGALLLAALAVMSYRRARTVRDGRR